MALDQIEMNNIIDQLKSATADQLLLINKTSADLFKMARRIEGRQAMGNLEVGMRCMFPSSTRPQYLARQLCTVVEIRQTRVLVKLDNGPMGKFRSGRVLTNPASLVILKNQPVKEN